jgi:hypothetical protein
MSHSSSTLIILGATILSLILVTGSVYAFAQQEEDEEKEEDEKEEKEESEESEESKEEESEESSKDDDDSDSSSNEETSEQPKEEESTETPIPNTTAVPEIIIPPTQEPIVNLTGDQILNTIPVTETTTIAEPIKEFNATCKCMTTSAATKPTTTSQQLGSNNNQIPVTSANIVDSKSLGQVIDANYTGFYTVSNLLDNKIDDISFWSQAGKSSFYIKLDNILDQYQVCSAELNVHKPTNAPFLLDIGVTKDYTGVIDQTTEKIQFDKCVKNMDEILVSIENPANTYISIAELKLFGSKLGAATITTPQQTTIPQPTLEPQTPTENANKINIQDSIAEIAIKNSTVTFKFDPMTATFVQQGATNQ